MKRAPFRADRPECEMTSGCYAGGAWGFTVVSSQWDESDEAQQALRAIVSDPAYGVGALSSSQIMANLLKDLLPDAPREVSILVAAAEAGVASNLRDRVSQGMDVGTASAVVAGSFAASTPFRSEACSWAVNEIAGALGLSSSAPSTPSAPSPSQALNPAPGPALFPSPSVPPGSSVPGDAQPTIAPPLSGVAGSYAPGAGAGGFPQASGPGGYPAGGVPGAYPAGAVPGGYPPAAAPSGFRPAGQAPAPGPYPSGPPRIGNAPVGSAPGGYQAAGGYPSPPVPGYWPQPPAPGFDPVRRTNGLAIASLVLGILWLFWLGSLASLILGLVALKQIKSRNEGGRGMAIAGVVLGILGLVFLVIGIIAAATNGSSGS